MSTISVRLKYEIKECGGKTWTWIESPDMREFVIAYTDVERAVSIIVPLVRILQYRNRRVLTDDTTFDASELLSKGHSTLVLTLADGPRKKPDMPEGAGEFWKTAKGTVFMVPMERSFSNKVVHPDLMEKVRDIDH